MEYAKFGETVYIRFDKGDEIIAGILNICRKEKIGSAVFSGIGGCRTAEIQVFLPDEKRFMTEEITGSLEMASMNGNVTTDGQGAVKHHAHAVFSYLENGEHKTMGGHIKSTEVLYTAEIELRPVKGGLISQSPNPETGTGFWKFVEE